jgi:dolichol-phosphate mannosyltransferase
MNGIHWNGLRSSSDFKLSIVVPGYNEEGNLRALHREIADTLQSVDWELIVTDDGSTDKTWATILALNEEDPRVKGVRLSRNFGHQYALMAGMTRSTGDAVVTMDADLQHPPATIPELLSAWQSGAKIVNTVRIDAQSTSLFKRATSRWFYRMFSFLSGVRLESGMADFRLLDRRPLDDLLLLKEDGLFLRGLVEWLGYPTSTVEFQCRDRFSGKTKFSLWKMVRLAVTGTMSFSLVPLRLSIVLGLATSALAFTYMIYAVAVRLFTDSAVPGWASAVGILSLLFGVLFVLVGILGEYLGRVLVEVRGRPRFLVGDTVGFPTPDAGLGSATEVGHYRGEMPS